MEGATKKINSNLCLAVLLTDAAEADDRVTAFNLMYTLSCNAFVELERPSTAKLVETVRMLDQMHPNHVAHVIYAGKESDRDLGSISPDDLVRCLRIVKVRVVLHLRGVLPIWWEVAIAEAGASVTLELGLVTRSQRELCGVEYGKNILAQLWPKDEPYGATTPLESLQMACHSPRGCRCLFFSGKWNNSDETTPCAVCGHRRDHHLRN